MNWKNKINDVFSGCKSEISKTTQIGQKMLYASRQNTVLNECYQELGKLTCDALEKGELTWDKDQASKLIKKINKAKAELHELEEEVEKIKKG